MDVYAYRVGCLAVGGGAIGGGDGEDGAVLDGVCGYGDACNGPDAIDEVGRGNVEKDVGLHETS